MRQQFQMVLELLAADGGRIQKFLRFLQYLRLKEEKADKIKRPAGLAGTLLGREVLKLASRQARTRRPGRAPGSTPLRRVTTPFTTVAT